AVRPVDADAIADRTAEELVHRDAEGARLDVEQRVLDGPDGLLDEAAGGLAAQRVHQGDVGLPRPRVLPHEDRGALGDHPGHAGAAERLVVLAPAGDALVGADLEEIVVAPAHVGVQGVDPGDLHRASSRSGRRWSFGAGRLPGTDRLRKRRALSWA